MYNVLTAKITARHSVKSHCLRIHMNLLWGYATITMGSDARDRLYVDPHILRCALAQTEGNCARRVTGYTKYLKYCSSSTHILAWAPSQCCRILIGNALLEPGITSYYKMPAIIFGITAMFVMPTLAYTESLGDMSCILFFKIIWGPTLKYLLFYI